MSIFKEHKRSADRSASDRRRHKEKIEDAIRDGIYDIVAEESIIGQDGKKKIRIPVRGIKEYRFVYGDGNENKKVGSAPGKNVRRGQQIGKKQQQAQGDKPGNEQGEEYYDVEITLEELASYLFDNLDLPDLEKKRFKNIIGEKTKRKGYRNEGIRPRLDKRKTAIQRIKRKSTQERIKKDQPDEDEERFPFHDNDLKYRHIAPTPRESSNAVVFFMMDVSGSMTKKKKYIARSFFFLLYQFLRHKYDSVEVVFIAHSVDASEVSEDQFFSRGQGGGTLMSSALDLTLGIIKKRFHPNSWNVYAFHCSDGDNWPEDNDKATDLSQQLRDLCQLYGYCEIKPDSDELGWGSMQLSNNTIGQRYEAIQDNRFKTVKICDASHIWPAFKRFFGGKNV
jgi:sporulation protein YhbH